MRLPCRAPLSEAGPPGRPVPENPCLFRRAPPCRFPVLPRPYGPPPFALSPCPPTPAVFCSASGAVWSVCCPFLRHVRYRLLVLSRCASGSAPSSQFRLSLTLGFSCRPPAAYCPCRPPLPCAVWFFGLASVSFFRVPVLLPSVFPGRTCCYYGSLCVVSLANLVRRYVVRYVVIPAALFCLRHPGSVCWACGGCSAPCCLTSLFYLTGWVGVF